MTLVALFAMTAGAWAQDVTWNVSDISTAVGGNMGENEPYTKDGITMKFVKIEVGGSCTIGQNIEIWGGGGVLEFTAPEGMKFTKIVINGSGSQSFGYWNKVKYGDGYQDGVYSLTWEDEPAEVVTTSSTTDSWDLSVSNASTIEFYFAEEGIDLTPDATRKVWTLDAMPAGDVELQVEYAPAATATAAPTAATGDIFAGSTAALVTAGTTTEGTMMYAVGTSATEAPNTFSSDVPTAASLTEPGTYYVWYYIMGGTEYNDSEILGPIEVTVKSDKFDIQFNAANANTIQAGKATVKVGDAAKTLDEEGQLKQVKMGSKVTLTAANGYKFRKVEATKGISTLKSVKIGNYTVYYAEGETWYQAFWRDENNNCGLETSVGRVFTYGNKSLRDSGGDVYADAVINPSKGYYIAD
jgi:hypothetical protein